MIEEGGEKRSEDPTQVVQVLVRVRVVNNESKKAQKITLSTCHSYRAEDDECCVPQQTG